MVQAHIRCVTFSGGVENTLETSGHIDFNDAYTRVSFTTADYGFSITVFDTYAEIAREGNDAYRVLLLEGKTTPLESSLLKADVHTHALKAKRTETAFSVMVHYALENEPIKLFVTATPQ